MSDDIREVMRPTPFSPLKRVNRSGRHKSNSEYHSGGWADAEDEEVPGDVTDSTIETLAREVDAANERLAAAGKKVRLRLADDAGAPCIEIILPGSSGGEVVSRRIAPGEIQAWVVRIETAEGLLLDETL